MICAGIDPGLDGAVAILFDHGHLTLKMAPTLGFKGSKRDFDLPQMRKLMHDFAPSLVVIEKVASRPGQGVSSVFRFGEGFGMWQGVLAGLEIPYQLVTPQKWKSSILAGTKKDKQAAIQVIQRRFPGVSLLATSRSRVPHDGMADAAALALYARKLMNGK